MEKNDTEKKKKSFSFGFLVGAIIIIALIAAVIYLAFRDKDQVSTTPVATNAPIHVIVDGGNITVDNTKANPVPIEGNVIVDNPVDKPVNVKEVDSCCGNGCENKKPCSGKKEEYVPARKQAYIPAPTPTCISACTFGAKQCVGNQVQTCGLVGACYGWQISQTCASNESCSNGSCIRNQQVENRCNNGDVYKYVDGSMTSLVEDCGSNTYEEEYRCNGSDTLQRKYVERGCENSSCYSRTTWKYQDSCSYGCSGNRCSSRPSQTSDPVGANAPNTTVVNVYNYIQQQQGQQQGQQQQPAATTQQPAVQEPHTGTSFSAPVDQNLTPNCTTTGTCGAFTVPVGTCTGGNCGTFTPPVGTCTGSNCGTFTPPTGGCTNGNCGTFVPPVGGSIIQPPTN